MPDREAERNKEIRDGLRAVAKAGERIAAEMAKQRLALERATEAFLEAAEEGKRG